MRTRRAGELTRVGLIGLLLASCSSGGGSSDPTSGGVSTVTTATASSTAPANSTSPSTAQPTEASPPSTTTGTTVASGPPVFDPVALGDNRTLPSLTLTVTVANTNNGQLSKSVTTTRFVGDPVSVSKVATFSSDGTKDRVRNYLVEGRSYEENQFGDWYLYEAANPSAPDVSDGVDLRSGTLAGVLTARFDGPGEFAGTPANHFVFDETDLSSYSSYSADRPSPTVVGDFYLAQDGNYVLFTHSKETSPGRIYEVTEELVSVGEVAEITLPAELTPMTEALDLGVEFSRLLPPGSTLLSMIRYEHGIGLDYYSYLTPAAPIDELLDFYRALPPTDGWSVKHIGHVKPHLEQINCETDLDCVMLTNGGKQIVVSFGAGITIEVDHDHIFSAL